MHLYGDKLYTFNNRMVTYIYNNLWRWELHHCVPHELAIPFIYTLSQVLMIKLAQRLLFLFKKQNIHFNRRKQTLVTTKYEKTVNIFILLT